MKNSTKKIFALVQTKSNFHNTNNRWLEVVEFVGTLVVCKIPLNDINCYDKDSDVVINADFSLSEIKRIVHA